MAYGTCRICLQGQVSANCSMSSPYSYSSRATASAHSPGKDSHVPEGKLLLLLYAFSGLCCKKFGCKEEVFTVRVVRCWHRLPREVVDAPSLEMFKARLDGALGSRAQGGSPSLWQGWNFEVPSSLSPCGSGQCGLIVGDTVHSRGIETRISLWSFSTQAIL